MVYKLYDMSYPPPPKHVIRQLRGKYVLLTFNQRVSRIETLKLMKRSNDGILIKFKYVYLNTKSVDLKCLCCEQSN